MAQIKHRMECKSSMTNLTAEFDCGLFIDFDVHAERYWDGSVDYEIVFQSSPYAKLMGERFYIDLSVPVLKMQTIDDDENLIIGCIEQHLFDTKLDKDFEDHPEWFSVSDDPADDRLPRQKFDPTPFLKMD